MILDSLKNLKNYEGLHPRFAKAMDFLLTSDLANLPLGRNEIQGDEIFANVVIKVRGKEQKMEITVPAMHYTLRSEESHNDLYAAIDIVTDKLERQIRKNKTT